ncbi:D-glycerate dehydrogenase [Burkholderiaceae bacterium FT117]|uniref:2-hydroxyacid dehydrogenase n=1 Tax=Zeimonas sediminis TaxID=2944268 RepID=UPI002342C47B|nr:D-glycerate dehydrogenase [Zeimonas sediminis]MCM5572152.1 D-glycerate dehydrogenase [Zeimonas sediminis]
MGARPKLLITRRIFPEVLERLDANFDIVSNQADDEWSAADLLARVADRDALFVVASDRVDRALLDAAPKLRVVSTGSVGYNHIDLAACKARGIAVGNTPEVLTEATADMAWTLLMAAARRVSESERWLRDGQWKRWAFDQFLGADLFRSTLGIIGMGRIGSAVARRARGFEMTVLYSNRSRAANEAEVGAQYVERDELLARADHVVLVLPYSQATHHTIGERELSLMKPTATLVNIARGGIVDDAALARALKAGRIAAAGLDVYENEPALNPELLDAPGVVLTPHIGSATRSSRVGMAMLAADNLIAFFEGRPMPAQVPLG